MQNDKSSGKGKKPEGYHQNEQHHDKTKNLKPDSQNPQRADHSGKFDKEHKAGHDKDIRK
jgi:hypothetical protein